MVGLVEDWLKQRLVGAVVLVALGVIFIPMVVESPKQEPTSAGRLYDADMPETDFLEESPRLTEIVIPIPEESLVVGTAAGESPEVVPEPTVVGHPKAETVTPAAPAEKKVEDAPPPSSNAVSSWVVQVGSFKREANAMALRDKLRKGGLACFVERVKSSSGSVYRVRVGPEMSYAKVKQMKKSLQQRFSLSGVIMKHR